MNASMIASGLLGQGGQVVVWQRIAALDLAQQESIESADDLGPDQTARAVLSGKDRV
jgi:hypothetical protein